MADKLMTELKDVEELKTVLDDSSKEPVILFKHSLTCPISANAFREMSRFHADNSDETMTLRMIVVQRSRPVSDAVEQKLGIRHESPQVILIRDRKPVWDASHYDITEEAVVDALRSND